MEILNVDDFFFYLKKTKTWCHRSPAETPASGCVIGIRAEEYFHSVASSNYQQVVRMRWVRWKGSTGPVHQGYAVSIPDFDKVARAGGDVATVMNVKVGELQPQYLPILHFDGILLFQVV